MIAVIDYGVGNLFSLGSALKRIGEDYIITANADEIKKADRIILPGVGAFRDAREKLAKSGLDEIIISEAKNGKPVLGICLGMQLLLDKSYEYGEYEGLGLIKGNVKPIADFVDKSYKVPHMGWNALNILKSHPLFKYTKNGDFVYFVHSYFATDCDSVLATAEYGTDITASVGKDNITGCQFHPEKSGETGLKILKAFCEIE